MKRWMGVLVAGAMLVLVSVPGWGAEERTVKASAAWVGQGRFFSTGTETLYFVGAFSGILFVDNDQGLLNTAKILCPGTLEVEINGGALRGEGRCVMTDHDGNHVFARWTCAGTHQVECKGTFTLTGGTGRFGGIAGQSEFRVRTAIAELAIGQHMGEGIHETAAGIAEWPTLRYRIP
jgi:hypothetical protein